MAKAEWRLVKYRLNGVSHLFSTWGHVKNQRLTPTSIIFLRHDPAWRPYHIPLQTRLTKRHSGNKGYCPRLELTEKTAATMPNTTMATNKNAKNSAPMDMTPLRADNPRASFF